MPVSSTTRLVPWRDEFRDFFSLAGANWTPPAVVKSVVNPGRSRLTMSGTFEQPDGTRVHLSTRCIRRGDLWFVKGETLRLRLTLAGRLVAA
jgi:hypothetical protein